MSIPSGPILIVEDIPHVLELLEVTLRFKGYPVVTAHNGDEALEIIAGERPALIITDILMPKLNGFALAQQVRRNPKTQSIPILFISATYITPEDKAFALSLGAVTFLEKPIDTQELLLSVAEILTATPKTLPDPLSDQAFYQGYRERLEVKLKHKRDQITRARRLVETVSEAQRAAFEALLSQTQSERDEIEGELQALYRILEDGDSPQA